MTLKDYQTTYGVDLRKFLETPAGKEFLPTLGVMSPQYEPHKEEHMFIENRGAIRGYAQAIRSVMALTFIPNITSQPEATYGVPDKTEN